LFFLFDKLRNVDRLIRSKLIGQSSIRPRVTNVIYVCLLVAALGFYPFKVNLICACAICF
jgi:hypothetical protein